MNSNNIYIRGVEVCHPRIDEYSFSKVYLGDHDIPEDGIVATIEPNQMIISRRASSGQICCLRSLGSANYFNLGLEELRQCLGQVGLLSDCDIWQSMFASSFYPILWNIRCATLYLKHEKIQIWNQVAELTDYLVDSDMYDLVDREPTGRSIVFSGSIDNLTVELKEPNDKKGLIRMKFHITRQNLGQVKTLFVELLAQSRPSGKEKQFVESIEAQCDTNWIAEYQRGTQHSQSGIEYLLVNPDNTDMFNTLYRIGMRWFSKK